MNRSIGAAALLVAYTLFCVALGVWVGRTVDRKPLVEPYLIRRSTWCPNPEQRAELKVELLGEPPLAEAEEDRHGDR